VAFRAVTVAITLLILGGFGLGIVLGLAGIVAGTGS
jgi:hypothetical protein